MEDEIPETDPHHLAFFGLAAVVGAASYYVSTVRVERKKRKKIEEWKLMNQQALQASAERWDRLAADPNSTAQELLDAFVEESQFLDLVLKQPMY